jgi:hypothetical protein
MARTTELKMVTGHELKKLLKSMSLWEDFQRANLHCEFCGCLVSQKNLASLFSFQDRFAVGCDHYECYKYFLGICVNTSSQ